MVELFQQHQQRAKAMLMDIKNAGDERIGSNEDNS